MTNSLPLGGLYILMAVMLVLGMVMSRREPAARLLTATLAWLSIFAGGFIVFTFRDDLAWLGQRLHSEATGRPMTEGAELRIPMAIDGHFWVDGQVNGSPVKFLVDSGATMTTVGRATAQRVGLEVSPTADRMVRTGNGIVRMSRGRAAQLAIGSVERRDIDVHVAESEDLNVLGMNFLSSLTRWGVEGRWLVLVS